MKSTLAWRKSSYSVQEGECVEVAPAERSVAARDSKIVAGPQLGFPADAWEAFVRRVG